MIQRLERDLGKYHDLFAGGRCAAWELEELLVACIQSDMSAGQHVVWSEAGHDTEADIVVTVQSRSHSIQVKSGQVKKDCLVLSGNRLGRFEGSMVKITEFLQSSSSNILAVPYKQINDHHGRQHKYQVTYVDKELLTTLSSHAWKRSGQHFMQVNDQGVEFSIRPSMSWQVWWKIPISRVEQEEPFVIG